MNPKEVCPDYTVDRRLIHESADEGSYQFGHFIIESGGHRPNRSPAKSHPMRPGPKDGRKWSSAHVPPQTPYRNAKESRALRDEARDKVKAFQLAKYHFDMFFTTVLKFKGRFVRSIMDAAAQAELVWKRLPFPCFAEWSDDPAGPFRPDYNPTPVKDNPITGTFMEYIADGRVGVEELEEYDGREGPWTAGTPLKCAKGSDYRQCAIAGDCASEANVAAIGTPGQFLSDTRM